MKSQRLWCAVLAGGLCGVLMAGLCGPLVAAELPPENMEGILRAAERGDVLGLWEVQQIDKFAKDHMWRVRCTGLEQAEFSIAQLEVKGDRPEKALEALEKLAAATKNADVQSAAQYDIGRVYWQKLNDTEKATEAFKKVQGRFAERARRDLVLMARESGQVGKAIEFLQTTAAQCKDKGEKLALLRRLGELCKETQRTEDALAAYRQIADEFTPEDIEKLKTDAAGRVADMFKNISELRAEHREREADEEMTRTRAWTLQLDAAGREDEFRAATTALEDGWRKIEEAERKAKEAREKKPDEPKEKEKKAGEKAP